MKLFRSNKAKKVSLIRAQREAGKPINTAIEELKKQGYFKHIGR